MIAFSIRSLGSRANLHLKLCSCLFTAYAMAQTGNIKAVLVDLSGTLHVENRAIPGAVEALKRLRTANLNIRFVTNTTKESKRILLERLQNQGFEIQANEIFTSLTAARNLVEGKGLRPMLLLEDAALEDYNGILLDDPNAVVVGLAPSKLNYQTMQIAFSLLLTGAPLIAIHKGRYYKRSDGLALGPGPFVVGLEYATDSKAIVVGKPEKTFFLEALSGLDCQPESTIMIGDDVRDDIEGAQKTGMRGILVKTGKYRDLDEQKITPPPSVVCEDFSAAVNVILSKLL